MQLDTSFHGAHVTRPDMQICGFKCIHLEADAAAEITFHLKTAQIGCYNEHVDFVVRRFWWETAPEICLRAVQRKQPFVLTAWVKEMMRQIRESNNN